MNPSNKRIVALVALAIVAAVVIYVLAGGRVDKVEPSGLPLPDSMAAIGDSITQAVAIDRSALEASGGATPEHSWATGSDADDSVLSHYERLVAENPDLSGQVFNNSVSGARMADALEQTEATVGQRVQYVVFLMGANDACTPNAATMTSTADFESQFSAAMDRLATGLPNTAIYVVSIPDLFRLWEVLHEELAATTIWGNAGICQSMLAGSNTDADRAAVRERNIAFNAILERVCGGYPNCRFDDNALFDFEFSADDVGSLDYFHPSEQGQANLAEVSWNHGLWPDL